MQDEGVLDPRLVEMLKDSPGLLTPFEDLSPAVLDMARGPALVPPTRAIDHVTDDDVDGTPVRIYQDDGPRNGLVVYFHGGGFVLGSIGLMDNVARALAAEGDVAVVSVGYRLAPEHPYPAGLDDCEKVTRWAHANVDRFGVSPDAVVVGGESAGGNLATAVALRLRGEIALAGQVLIYPGTSGSVEHPSRSEFDGLVLNRSVMKKYWDAYSGGRDLDADPGASPLAAPDLTGLPPALVQLGGCDVLRDEGRAYAARLRDAGVDVEEICYPGQPHGFVNMEFPAAADAFTDAGSWLRRRLAAPTDHPARPA